MSWAEIEALIPSTVMAALFIALLVTAFRATDGARRREAEEDAPDPADRPAPPVSPPD